MAVLKAGADLHGKTIGGPHGLPGIPQASFVFSGATSLVQALRHGREFARQGPEHREIGDTLAE